MRQLLASLLGVAAVSTALTSARADPAPAPNQVTYDVPSQPVAHGRLSQGWGLFATISGRSMNLGALDLQWSDDPSVQPHDVEAGYGWRRGATTAVIGYEEHDFGPRPDAATRPDLKDADAPRGGSGVLGLSLILHAP